MLRKGCPLDKTKQHLCNQLAIDGNAGTAIVVEAVPVAALLIGVQVHTACLGRAALYQVQPLVQLPQLPSNPQQSIES